MEMIIDQTTPGPQMNTDNVKFVLTAEVAVEIRGKKNAVQRV
jgi:hypothetical protein